MSDLANYRDAARAAIAEATDIALSPPAELSIETKANRNDLVTAVDRLIEARVAQRLTESTGLPLLGEEGHSIESFDGDVWVLDPIDGTMNYCQTRRDYAISLALCRDGVPQYGIVADPVGGHLYEATVGQGATCDGEPLTQVPDVGYRDSIIITDLKEMVALPRLMQVLQDSRGHRRYGSAALECIEVAASRAGAFVHMWVSPWDIAAATLICQEAGVIATRLDGTPLDIRYPGSILVGAPSAHRELLAALMSSASLKG